MNEACIFGRDASCSNFRVRVRARKLFPLSSASVACIGPNSITRCSKLAGFHEQLTALQIILCDPSLRANPMQNPMGLGGLQDDKNSDADLPVLQEMMPDQQAGDDSGSNSGGDEEDEEHED